MEDRSSLPMPWLPSVSDWRPRLKAILDDPAAAWEHARLLANASLDFGRTHALDETLRRALAGTTPQRSGRRPVRLAILGSCTTTHLLPSIRVGGLRRGLCVTTYENSYGQYLQELHDTGSRLHEFRPDTVLVCLDAKHLTRGVHSGLSAAEVRQALDHALDQLRGCWRSAREAFGCHVIQQTVVNTAPALMGSNEQRLPGSRRLFIDRLNHALRHAAEADAVDLLAIDAKIAEHGIAAWHDPALWHRSKQEIAPAAAPLYGDLVGRLLGAQQGRSAKCLVLDLDDTLWGGAIGDDGLDGIVLGQGSALGEGFLAVQEYALELSRRGVILAVCSKNDEARAWEAFEKHPDMVLRRQHIACFRANWQDKPANLRSIAEELDIGLDALVLLDDNAFERNLVREALPMVAVPEVPDEPALIPRILADAGYFEALAITDEDRARTGQYRGNTARALVRASATDLDLYLADREMRLVWKRFDRPGLPRIVQLINKTNQFNLTTRRYTDVDVLGIMDDPGSVGLQLRLFDRFGDNGVIAIVIGRMRDDRCLLIDTWLMSCRVLGRRVEAATLNLIAAEAKRLGADRLVGEYVATGRNALVKDHYPRLGFSPLPLDGCGGSLAALDLATFEPLVTSIAVTEG